MLSSTTTVDDLAVLEEMVDTGNTWDAVKCALCTDMPDVSPGMQFSDFTLATFAGSTPLAVTWGSPYTGPSGNPQVDSQLMTFISTDVDANELIQGIIITNTGGTIVKSAVKFDEAVPIAGAGPGIAVVFELQRRACDATLVS